MVRRKGQLALDAFHLLIGWMVPDVTGFEFAGIFNTGAAESRHLLEDMLRLGKFRENDGEDMDHVLIVMVLDECALVGGLLRDVLAFWAHVLLPVREVQRR
jgi:hypothetical protein